MPRRILLASISIIVVTLIAGVAMFNQDSTTKGASPRMHKIELPAKGLTLINNSDPDYSSYVDEWLDGSSAASEQVARTLKPFSAFLKNSSDKDILAYKLNWELKMPNGRVINYPRTFFAVDYLTGTPRSDRYDRAMGSIKKQSKKFFTVIPTPLEADSQGAFAVSIEPEDLEKFQQEGMGNDIGHVIAHITEQLSQSTDITISIDSVLFDNGEFVGPAGDQEFVKLKASVAAKHDLLKDIRKALTERKTPLNEVLNRVAKIADQEIPLPAPDALFGGFYNYFRKLQAQEIKSARQALGNDSKTIGIFLRRLDGKWIIPYHPQ